MNFAAVFDRVSEGYIALVEELPGAISQGDTLDEARENPVEVVELVLAANRALAEDSILGTEVIREALVLAAR